MYNKYKMILAFLIILCVLAFIGVMIYIGFTYYKEEPVKQPIKTRIITPAPSHYILSPVNSNYNINGIFDQLQKLLNQFQIASCQYASSNPSLFDGEIKKLVEKIRNAPVKCEDSDKQIGELIKTIPGEQYRIKASLEDLWRDTKPMICNANGFIDADLMETLLRNIYHGFCNVNNTNIDETINGYVGYYIYTQDDPFGNYIKKLRDVLYELQKQICPSLKQGLDSARTKMREELAKQNMSCNDADRMFKENIDREIISKIPPNLNIDKEVLKKNMYKMNEYMYKNVCKNGNVDPDMVVKLYDNVHSSMCYM